MYCIDSQPVKTLMGGLRGYDGNKKLVERKRHILVDTQGFLLAVVAHAASISDRAGGQWALEAAADAFPRLQRIWADQGYTGALVRWVAQAYGWTVQVVYPTDRRLKRFAPDVLADLGHEPGFHVIPKRWVVERAVSWFGRQRRLSKDYERLASTETAFIYLVRIRLLLARLAPAWQRNLDHVGLRLGVAKLIHDARAVLLVQELHQAPRTLSQGNRHRLGSDCGSPNHGSTLLSKRVMAQIRSSARVST